MKSTPWLLSVLPLLYLPMPLNAQGTPPTAQAASSAAGSADWSQKGRDAYDAGHYQEAIEALKKALEYAPPNKVVAISINLSHVFVQTGKFTDAAALLEARQKTSVGAEDQHDLAAALADTQFAWAKSLRQNADYGQAAIHLQKALKIDQIYRPADAALDLNSLGNLYAMHLRQPAQAINYFQQGLTYAHQVRDTRVEMILLGNLAAVYDQTRDFDKAISVHLKELALARKRGDTSAQIHILNEMADRLFLRSHDEQAAALYGQEAELQKTMGDLTGMVETLRRLQSLYFLAGQYGRAAETKARMLTAQRELGDTAGARETLKLIGPLYAKAGLYEKAIPAYEELLAQQRTDKDQTGEARTLINLALAYRKLSQPEHAAELLEQSLAINQGLNDRVAIERVLVDMGAVQVLDLHRYDAGVALYTRALTMQREDHNPKAEGKTLSSIGLAYIQSGQYTTGLDYCLRALPIQQGAQDMGSAAETLNNIGLANLQLDRPDDAAAAFLKAAPLMRQAKNQHGEMFSLTGVGSAYAARSEYRRAIQADRLALALSRSMKDHTGEATILNNMADVYRKQSRYGEALDAMKQVVAVFHAIGDAKNEAITQINLGEVYAEMGQHEKAIDFYTRALAVQKRIGDQSGMEATLGNLGAAESNLGRNEEAVDDFMQSLALARERGDRSGEATALTNLGVVRDDLGQTQTAVDSFQLALAIFSDIKDARSEAATLNDLGVVYHQMRQTTQSADVYTRALWIQRRIGDRDGEAATLANLMVLWRSARPESAIWCGKIAVNIYQEIRGSLQARRDDPTGEMQKSFAASKESVYRGLADALITQGRLTEARQVLRMLKQEEFFDFLSRDPKSAPGLPQRVTLTDNEKEGEKRYAGLAEEALLPLLFDEMALALRASRSAADLIPGDSEAGGLSTSLAAMAPGTVALYTIVEPDKYRVIIVTPTSQRADEYPIAAKDLYGKVLAFRSALQDPTRDPRPLARELYQIMLGPIAADLKAAHATTILWSLDDALRYLPCAALHDGKQYLAERYSMSIFTPAGESRLTAGPAMQWRGLGLGVSRAYEDFPALPGVAEELGGILQGQTGYTQGVLPGTVLMNSLFTRQTLTNALAQNRGLNPRYPIVHIASHFSLSSRDTNSFLLLGDGEHLSVAQIKSNPLFFQGVDLLALSACNTAIDVRSSTGREVEGFGALAQRLGARSVLASLWPVADASTPVLMREFYRLRRAHPTLSKASDLRQAQLELLRGQVTAMATPSRTNRAQRAKVAGAANTSLPPFVADPKAPYSHPYYWAPFVLIGNPE
jgi:CHAT domain-containing protein/tetratricopeptide (TPR) repeat protein